MKLYFCKQCGLLAPAGSASCPRCGQRLPRDPFEPAAPELPQDEAGTPRFGPQYQQDAENTEMGVGRYLVTLLLCGLPAVGLVLMMVWASGATRWEERRRLASAYLIRRIAADLILLALGLALHSLLLGWLYAPMLIGY